MAIEIVDLFIKNGGSFHSYVSLPEGSGHFLLVMESLKNPSNGVHHGDLMGPSNNPLDLRRFLKKGG